MSFLSEHTNKSSMRLSLLLTIIACFVLLLSVAGYIIVSAVKSVEITQWQNMGIFCLGIAGVVTGATYTKALQKKSENSEPKT